jgi:hypothetical protein
MEAVPKTEVLEQPRWFIDSNLIRISLFFDLSGILELVSVMFFANSWHIGPPQQGY